MNAVNRRVVIHDPTLRDGQHAVGHQLDTRSYAATPQAANRAGIPVVEVGHGNGLGASSLQIGRSRLDDDAMLATVREVLTDTRMAAFMAPGWGTGKDIRRAVDHGVDVVRIAAHCTEASVTERHVGLVRDLGVEAQTVLLMSHMADAGRLAEECAKAVDFGAQAVGRSGLRAWIAPSRGARRIGRRCRRCWWLVNAPRWRTRPERCWRVRCGCASAEPPTNPAR